MPIYFYFLSGVGKSTLLRALAHRELRLPSHVTILHVEQEVVGDDTTAVDSVLESDEERTRLIKLEKELTGASKQGRLVSYGEGEDTRVSLNCLHMAYSLGTAKGSAFLIFSSSATTGRVSLSISDSYACI